jgi:hypothetical protein
MGRCQDAIRVFDILKNDVWRGRNKYSGYLFQGFIGTRPASLQALCCAM